MSYSKKLAGTPRSHAKVTDLATNSPNANTDLSNPQEQRIAEYKQLQASLPSPAKPKTDADKGWNGALEACRAIIETRIKELE